MQSLVLFCYNYLISVTNMIKTFNSGNMETHKEKTKPQQQCFKFVLIVIIIFSSCWYLWPQQMFVIVGVTAPVIKRVMMVPCYE